MRTRTEPTKKEIARLMAYRDVYRLLKVGEQILLVNNGDHEMQYENILKKFIDTGSLKYAEFNKLRDEDLNEKRILIEVY